MRRRYQGKRVFDVVTSSVLLVLAAPVMLLATVLIAADTGFPVLYYQERIGQAGRVSGITPADLAVLLLYLR